MGSPQKAPRRSVLIAARLITALVALAGAEGTLRIIGYPHWWAMDPSWGGEAASFECDPDLGWSSRQGQFNLLWGDRSDPSDTVRHTNWSGGRRATSEHEPARATHPQVLFFGDSYVQGYGLADCDTLPWIVQARHPELQVSNYGVGLYGTYQSYLCMKKRAHGPAAVYYLLNAFHEERNAGDPSFLRIMKKPPPGCFYPYAQISQGELQDGRSEGELVWPLSRRFRTVAMVQEYEMMAKSYLRVQRKRQITEALLVKMSEMVRGEGGKFTLILFDLDPEERMEYIRFLRPQDIDFVDFNRPERKNKGFRLPDGHPSRDLVKLLAEQLEPLPAIAAPVTSGKPALSYESRLMAPGENSAK